MDALDTNEEDRPNERSGHALLVAATGYLEMELIVAIDPYPDLLLFAARCHFDYDIMDTLDGQSEGSLDEQKMMAKQVECINNVLCFLTSRKLTFYSCLPIQVIPI